MVGNGKFYVQKDKIIIVLQNPLKLKCSKCGADIIIYQIELSLDKGSDLAEGKEIEIILEKECEGCHARKKIKLRLGGVKLAKEQPSCLPN